MFLFKTIKQSHNCRILCQKQRFLIQSDRDDINSEINFKDIRVFFKACSRYRTQEYV